MTEYTTPTTTHAWIVFGTKFDHGYRCIVCGLVTKPDAETGIIPRGLPRCVEPVNQDQNN